MKIYFANALFSQADFDFNAQVVAQLRQAAPSLDIYLPQENAAINDKNAYADAKMIAQADTEQVLAADLMIAILDGPTIDVGVASEIGVAYAKHIPILGLYTDSRRLGATNQQKLSALQTVAENQFHYLNLYTVGLIKLNGGIYTTVEALVKATLAYQA
ncbi:MAG: nucleoside 2-deoxyribosyltransferase [Lactobacillus sp.]|jgi:nucleoside 2-deoxyribosyltransferase|uniref:Nucleoside 2-deoxyribosyltransferase n=1 Tax=Lacticaseibacillus suilingensis TaxID=2799577 RepID=A0ABW4BH26_9LACO|nr:nucleoside 2-deoxyribosyltransferase [Lacticaseibacillus suilingensis]MCI1893970.1 nucleoside 2-deoxyribosyltransferase [Lactobacillus sp.]MCI1917615.1 nucleoside 2-deoxyribosyltransferase [Lactobacillus sp.]MCI1941828.1 nucleoside 2-deoxyribosyltransferase [Lactobacillus sp.]MCI1972590.1 nucleoside 2-deoxyribosyltransferase [Lactobacillus sp.]MCI2017493.1 nucleoside 2-deoxyribosyltransferase [Lactobacillus sp.]